MDEPVPLTASIDGVLRSLRGTGRRQVGGVFGRWEEAVGATVAAHVRPLRLDGELLVVETDDPSWATQVKFLTGTIRERLRAVADIDVQRIEVRVQGRRS